MPPVRKRRRDSSSIEIGSGPYVRVERRVAMARAAAGPLSSSSSSEAVGSATVGAFR